MGEKVSPYFTIMNIAFSKPTLGIEEEKAVQRVLRSGWIAYGKEAELFEKEFSNFVGVKYALFTNSCTSALKIAYKWYKKQGIKSLTYYKNTYSATYSAGEEIGINMIPTTSYSPNVITHYGGVKLYGSLLEDSAHRIEPNDKLVGQIRCYSFHATKNMTTGHGGMFVTNDKKIYEFAKLCMQDGLTRTIKERHDGNPNYKVKLFAGGYDGNDICASIGREQLKKLPEFNNRRNEIVAMYNKAFSKEWNGNHIYPFMVKDSKEVINMVKFMNNKGIQCSWHYPNTGWNGVSLPLYPLLTNKEVNYVIETAKIWESSRNN